MEPAELVFARAAQASAVGPSSVFSDCVRDLFGRAERSGGDRERLQAIVSGSLIRTVRTLWERGWQPADIVRATRKHLDRMHVTLAATVIMAEAHASAGPGAAVPQAWAEQLRPMGRLAGPVLRRADATDIAACAELQGFLFYLPELPRLVPPPSHWGKTQPASVGTAPRVDRRMLEKVRALLAKAESTTFEEEAASLTAKAQELMARYAIDRAMVDPGGPSGEGPSGRRIGVEDPYASGKAKLLGTVCRANRCRSIWEPQYAFSTVFGFPADLDVVEVLYTSLLVQATRAMQAAGSITDFDGRSRTRSYRSSFLQSFAQRIGERLRGATTAATQQASQVHGDTLLPVLAGRVARVEEAMAEVFPHLRYVRDRISNYDGWVAGRVAADRAHLGPERTVISDLAG